MVCPPWLVTHPHPFFEDCLGVCISAANKVFTNGFEINSLAMAHSGAKVNGFRVTRWLEENEIIHLDDSDKENPAKQMQIVWTPGHTPDSAAFWFPAENRLFIGDTIYPFTAVHLDCIGSNVNDFMRSLQKLQSFVRSKSPSAVALPATESSAVPDSAEKSPYEDAITQFISILGLNRTQVEKEFNLASLMQLCDGSLEAAIEFYLSNSDGLGSLCPPEPPKAAALRVEQATGGPAALGTLKLSCGHVEENLDVSALDKALDMMIFIQAGAVNAQHKDGEYGEFCVENFTLMMPLKPKWN